MTDVLTSACSGRPRTAAADTEHWANGRYRIGGVAGYFSWAFRENGRASAIERLQESRTALITAVVTGWIDMHGATSMRPPLKIGHFKPRFACAYGGAQDSCVLRTSKCDAGGPRCTWR